MISILPFLDRWPLKERADFLLNIGHCLDRGIPLYVSIRLQQAEAKHTLRQRMERLIRNLESGLELPQVFSENGFPYEVTTYLHFSSQTGCLAQGFVTSGKLLKNQVERRKKIEHLLRYPLFLFILLGVMGYIILSHILPSFNELYKSMSLSLPFISRLLINFSECLPHLLIYLLLCFGFLTLSGFVCRPLFSLEKRLRFLISLPFLSYLTRLTLTSSFATHFGSLISVGMPINQALQIMGSQSYHPFLQIESRYLTLNLQQGHSLPQILSSRPFYTKDLPTIIRNGSEGGHLGEVLVEYSQLLFKNLEERMLRMIMLIQPLFFLLFGGLMLTMFLSILLPMFDIMKGL